MDGKLIRVLLVEDSPIQIRLIEKFLSGDTYSTFSLEVCQQLSTGLERLARNRFDIVVLDLSLPDSNGTDTLARTIEQSRGIPIVVLTGTDHQLIQMGAQDYLRKSQISKDILKRAIIYAVERVRTLDQLHLIQCSVEHSTAAMLWINEQGSIEFANPAASNMLGYAGRELIGKKICDIDIGSDLSNLTLLRFMANPVGNEKMRPVFRLSSSCHTSRFGEQHMPLFRPMMPLNAKRPTS
jgi:CheY-like chemotaxis protein